MGCGGDREKNDVNESQKWDYINLQDFSGSGLAYFSYAWLWMLAIVAVAVYGADTFTAVNLLAYDKWSGEIQPKIPLKYSKWIFAACIFFSWALCIFEWIRAVRVIRRRGVAESYMDPLAVTLQSIRPNGWKRFLVFAELTTSKKGTDYLALFVYFSFKGAVRIILAEGPRQAVNAITLYSFAQQSLLPVGAHAAHGDHSAFAQFWINVELLAEESREQTVVLFTMLFTLVIWVISALCLLISIILYICFLWHYIPQKDGRLSIYCRRKIDRRLEKIVGEKVKKALEDQEKKRLRLETKAAKKGNALPVRAEVARKPTLPQIATSSPSLPTQSVPSMQRAPTLPDLSVPSMQRAPTLPDLSRPAVRSNTASLTNLQLERSGSDPRRPGYNLPPPARTHTAPPTSMQRQVTYPKRIDTIEERPSMRYRSDTETSALSHATYASDASLLEHANDMSYDDDPMYNHAQPEPMLDSQMSYARSHTPYAVDRQTSYARNNTPYALDRQPSHPPRALPNRMMNGTPQQQMGRPSFDNDTNRRIMTGTPQHRREPSVETVGGRVIPTRATAGTLPQQQMTRQGYETGGRDWQHHSNEPSMMNHMAVQDAYSQPYNDQQQYNPHYQQQSNDSNNHFQQSTDASTSSFPANANPFLGTTAPLTRTKTPDPSSTQSFEMQPRPNTAFSTATAPLTTTRVQMLQAPPLPTPGSYQAFSPSVYATTPGMVPPPNRSFTNPPEALRPIGASVERSATAPPAKGAYEDLIDEYRGMAQAGRVEPPVRSGTAGPGGRSTTRNDW